MDEDRRRQIEEEERYRAEVRAKFEREDNPTLATSGTKQATPEKPKRRGGCLRNVFGLVLVLVALAFIGSLLPDTDNSETNVPAEREQPAAQQNLSTPAVIPEPAAQTEPADPPEPVSLENSKITLPSGDTIDYFGAIVLCEGLVKDRLAAPRSAKFPGVFRGNSETPIKIANSWAYNVLVDSENSFGATLRSSWLCTLSGDDDTSYVTQLE